MRYEDFGSDTEEALKAIWYFRGGAFLNFLNCDCSPTVVEVQFPLEIMTPFDLRINRLML